MITNDKETSQKLPIIRELPQHTVNLIAAGEVVERPASIVKELVENSLDANASHIKLEIENGGIDSIIITDDGHGMTHESIKIAVKRHSTSKLPDNNLSNINSFGFRGEAIASIVAVSDCTITSCTQGSESAWSVEFSGGKMIKESPSKRRLKHGTSISISKLFHNIPARRAFIRSPSTETKVIIETFKALAISNPHVVFSLIIDKKERFNLKAYPKEVNDALDARIADILGDDFLDNSISANFSHNSFPMEIKGRLAIPTLNSPSNSSIFLFVNGRLIKDKALMTILRIAYNDTIPRGRFPQAVIFIEIDPLLIDVNAHPAKTEIRLRQPVETKNILKHSIRSILRDVQPSTSSNLGKSFVAKAMTKNNNYHRPNYTEPYSRGFDRNNVPVNNVPVKTKIQQPQQELQKLQREHSKTDKLPPSEFQETMFYDHPLGSARAQIMGNYIISESPDALIIVDQHAAHERIIYEKLKAQLTESEVLPSQLLLSPYKVSCQDVETMSRIMKHQSIFEKLGFSVKQKGETNLIILSSPIILKQNDPVTIIQDFISTINETLDDNPESLSEIIYDKLFNILSSTACHAAVRGYAPLSISEMNALLRTIEKTPLSSQCNHGRPSFVSLKISDLETLFNRK